MSRKDIVCTSCPRGCKITVKSSNNEIVEITGYSCDKGEKYARDEYLNPTRILPTTVRVKNGELPLAPVKTASPIPVKLLIPSMKIIAGIEVEAPVKMGQIIMNNIMDTGVELVSTGRVGKKK